MSCATNLRPEQRVALSRLRVEPRRDDAKRVVHFFRTCARVDGAVEMRVQLAVLLERRTRRHNAQLSALEIEPRSAKYATVEIDHRRIQRRMQTPDVRAQALVQRTVHLFAGLLAPRSPDC